MPQDEVVTYRRRTFNDTGKYITGLLNMMRQQAHGFVLTAHRAHRQRVELGGDILIITARANRSLGRALDSLEQEKGWKATVILRPAPGDRGVLAEMPVESFAYLLDRVISTDPAHYLRKLTAVKDSDE